MRTYVPLFTDAYLRPNSKLTHNLALKSCTQKLTNFSPKIFLFTPFRGGDMGQNGEDMIQSSLFAVFKVERGSDNNPREKGACVPLLPILL